MALLTQLTFNNLIAKNQNQLFIAPHSILKPFIAHYTISLPAENTGPEYLTLIPDASGCIVCTYTGAQLQCRLWGPTTKTAIVKNDTQEIPMRLFVEFLPCGAYHLTGIDINELTDRQFPLEAVLPTLAKRINELFDQSQTIQDLIELLDTTFLSYLSEMQSPNLIAPILSHIQAKHGTISVKELSTITYYSERHLNRIITPFLGMNVKSYSKLLRINTALQTINHSLTFTDLAQNLNYYDQSHFIHDFKSVCGVTPTAYLQNMSDFYKEDFKF